MTSGQCFLLTYRCKEDTSSYSSSHSSHAKPGFSSQWTLFTSHCNSDTVVFSLRHSSHVKHCFSVSWILTWLWNSGTVLWKSRFFSTMDSDFVSLQYIQTWEFVCSHWNLPGPFSELGHTQSDLSFPNPPLTCTTLDSQENSTITRGFLIMINR